MEKNQDVLTKHIQNALAELGITVSEVKLAKIASDASHSIDEYHLAQKFGRPGFRIKPATLPSFEEIVKIGDFNNGYYDHLENNKQCKKMILAPADGLPEEELVLYWEGEGQNIPGGAEIYSYFAERGYEVVEKAHPSLLVNAMAQLTEAKLTELGIPTSVDIVLPTSEDSLFPDGGGLCFLRARRDDGKRGLALYFVDGEWGRNFAFLLRKKL